MIIEKNPVFVLLVFLLETATVSVAGQLSHLWSVLSSIYWLDNLDTQIEIIIISVWAMWFTPLD